MADDASPILQLRRAEPDDGQVSSLSPLRPLKVGESVTICHPKVRGPLLMLGTVDEGRLVHQLVLDACYVLAGNRDGHLATSLNREDAVSLTLKPLLESGQYYYFVADPACHDPFTWPIFTRLEDWTVPIEEFSKGVYSDPSSTGRLKHWNILVPSASDLKMKAAASAMSILVGERDDQQCVLTGCATKYLNENAHIVPETFGRWFERQDLHLRNADVNPTGGVNRPSNGLLLRRDYHASLDNFAWFPYPKLARYVAHFVYQEEAPLQAHLHHNCPLRLHRTLNQAALFARFALCIFSVLQYREKGPDVPKTEDAEDKSAGTVPSQTLAKRKRSSDKSDKFNKSHKEAESSESDPRTSKAARTAEQEDAYWSSVWHKYEPGLAALEETEWSDRPEWHYISFHPEFDKMLRLKRQYLKDHPEVRAVSEPSKLASSESWRNTAMDEPSV